MMRSEQVSYFHIRRQAVAHYITCRGMIRSDISFPVTRGTGRGMSKYMLRVEFLFLVSPISTIN